MKFPYLHLLRAVLLAWMSLAVVAARAQTPQGSVFTYQGELRQNGNLANASVPMVFDLWDAAANGTKIGTSIPLTVPVQNGTFTVALDFGAAAFETVANDARWLQVKVNGNVLSPRTKIENAPYAITAQLAYAVPAHSIGATQVNSSSVQVRGATTTCPAGNYVSAIGANGNVTCATDSLAAPAYLTSNAASPTLQSISTGNAGGLYGQGGINFGVQGHSDSSFGVYGTSTSGFGVYGVGGTGVRGESSVGDGVYGSGSSRGVYGTGATGVYGNGSTNGVYATGGDAGVYATGNSYGVYGNANANGVYGSGTTGLYGLGNSRGVYGVSDGEGVRGESSTTSGIGVVGYNSAPSGGTRGVYGEADSPAGYAIHGYSASGYAGYFDGKVTITGTLSKPAGSFKIDHPLDPANKYLYHSFVESPDMKNIYDGVATLDARGEAQVELPDYFEALNRDFRYQLTPLGQPAASLHIAAEIAHNRFRIAGGNPGQRVSWQVTGTRRDAYAQAHRIPTAVDKPADERGKYLYPELFGRPADLAIRPPRVEHRTNAAPPPRVPASVLEQRDE